MCPYKFMLDKELNMDPKCGLDLKFRHIKVKGVNPQVWQVFAHSVTYIALALLLLDLLAKQTKHLDEGKSFYDSLPL